MNNEMRDRFLLPILIPVGALAFVAFLALSVSYILLNVPHAVATGVALMLAFNLLMVFAAAAAAPNMSRLSMGMLGGIVLVPLLVGGVAAAGVVEFPDDHGEGGEGDMPVVEIAANNLQFDKDELIIPADTAFVLQFDNQEAQPHNVAILEEEGSSEALFREDPFTGPEVVEWEVEPIPAGEYYFLCEVHPNMNGTATVE
ncbi:MAG: cupredoxin domain-containing protein [Actinobacteria bacterium]|nr:cupredoxin domain-containing protein [Actinomycetota bacterium]